MKQQTKKEKRIRRHLRVRARIRGSVERPRLSVFRSARHLWAQLIDDTSGHTLVAVGDREVRAALKKSGGGSTAAGILLGERIAQKAQEKNITRAVFDRGGYRYHGTIKAIADAARKGGLRI